MRATLVKWILRTTSVMPLPLVHLLAQGVGRVAWLAGGKSVRIATRNIERCFPELDEGARKALVRATLVETAKAMLESGILWLGRSGRVEALVREVVGEHHLKDALEAGRGVILAVPHLGNWEVVGLHCSARHPMTSLYRPPRMAALDDLIRTARQRHGATLVPTNAGGVRKLLRALQENHVTAILPDQDPRDQGGRFAPFFGIEANTMVLLSRLAQRSGAPVLLSYAERLPRGRGFRLHFEPLGEAVGGEDLARSLETLNGAIERAVRRLPAQYQWTYQRFRTRPEGEPPFYG